MFRFPTRVGRNALSPILRLATRLCDEGLAPPRSVGGSRPALLTCSEALVYFRLPMQLKLYSREWCSWCIDAKDFLARHGYKFIEIDVGKDRQAYAEMTELSDQTYVPTFVAGDNVLANFDTDQLEKFLNEHQINP